MFPQQAPLDDRGNDDGDENATECFAAEVIVKKLLKDEGDRRNRGDYLD